MRHFRRQTEHGVALNSPSHVGCDSTLHADCMLPACSLVQESTMECAGDDIAFGRAAARIEKISLSLFLWLSHPHAHVILYTMLWVPAQGIPTEPLAVELVLGAADARLLTITFAYAAQKHKARSRPPPWRVLEPK